MRKPVTDQDVVQREDLSVAVAGDESQGQVSRYETMKGWSHLRGVWHPDLCTLSLARRFDD